MTSAAIVALRHRLHQIPELAYEEHGTAAVIRAELDNLGLGHVDGVAGAPTATVAMLGSPDKPCIALRADMDALPLEEQTGLPYASRHSGRMHACGHDGHSAILLGVASRLQAMERELPVAVKLIWQPAEEIGAGARRLVEAGVLDGRIGSRVAAVFGLHGWPGLPIGTVATKPGAILAATDNFRLTFVGRGCHGAYPHRGIDPIVSAAEAVGSLQQFVSREMDPTEPAVVTVGRFTAGTAANVIPDLAILEGTARTLSAEARRQVRQRMEQRCAGVAAAGGCDLRFEWFEGYPVTSNHPDLADYVTKIARQTFGPERGLTLARSSMGGEDFAYYLEKVPGCFFLLGVDPPGRAAPPLHSAFYDFADDALVTGVQMFVELIRNFAGAGLGSAPDLPPR
jgi:amidohydrolase